MTDPRLAYIALALVPGIGPARLHVLLARFGTADCVLGASLDDLAGVPGMSRPAATAVHAARIETAARVVERTTSLDGHVLLPSDPGFPPALRNIPDPPTLLFAQGDLAQLAKPAVAIVGSRSHSRYGAEVCRHLAGGSARAGLVVVSGMARGIDALAHRAALDAAGTTAGVLGNGLGVVYPAANRVLYERVAAQGALVTEFPPGERPNAGSFPRRNRLISGLARAVVVIEAREKSGALLTVDAALGQGREVLAVPGPITSPVSTGCNRLIQHGCKPVLGLRDVLEEYGLAGVEVAAAQIPNDLTPLERQTLTLLDMERHVDQLAAALNTGTPDTLAVLTSLEIRGLVAQSPGKRFRRASPLSAPLQS